MAGGPGAALGGAADGRPYGGPAYQQTAGRDGEQGEGGGNDGGGYGDGLAKAAALSMLSAAWSFQVWPSAATSKTIPVHHMHIRSLSPSGHPPSPIPHPPSPIPHPSALPIPTPHTHPGS